MRPLPRALFCAAVVAASCLTGLAQTNLLDNPGFDAGPTGNIAELVLFNQIGAWQWFGGTNAGFLDTNYVDSAPNALVLTFPENYAVQDFPAATGMSYVAAARLMLPSGAALRGHDAMTIGLVFHRTNDVVSGLFASGLTTNSPYDTWIDVGITARAPASAGSGPLSGRLMIGIQGEFTNFDGLGVADSLSVAATNIPVQNSQSGALWNAGFEFTAAGTQLEHLDNWTGFGNAGAIDGTRARSGDNSLMIYWTETLAGQTWPATGNQRYVTSAYLMSPSNNPFRSSGAAHGVVILEFLNASGNVIAQYLSPEFTPGSPTNAWVYHEAHGIAPLGTVYGRTLLGIVAAPGSNYSGVILFDDAAQRHFPTPSTNGLLVNGGFEDGFVGDAYSLDAGGYLPGWKWFGGGGGFITESSPYDGYQSLMVAWPENLVEQRFDAAPGATYRVDGFVLSGAAWPEGIGGGALLLEFFEGTNQFTYASRRFRGDGTTGAWHRLSVMGTAPSSGSVTGRVLAGIIGSLDEYGGSIHFDELSMSNVPPLADYDLWKFNSFGDTNLPLSEPGDDFDGDGMLNGAERIAGTQAGNAGSLFKAAAAAVQEDGQVVVTWHSVRGRIYTVSRLTNLVAGETFGVTSGMAATPPVNTVTDAPPELPVYYRIYVEEP